MLARLQMEEQWNMSADKKCINTKRDRKHINPQVSKLENMTQNKQNHTHQLKLNLFHTETNVLHVMLLLLGQSKDKDIA